MIASKRKYYCCFLFAMVVTSVLLIIGALVANHCMYHIEMIDKICIAIAIILCAIICGSFAVILLINKGIRNTINKYILISSIEENLKSIGAYKKLENKNYIVLPKIKIKNGTIKIILKDLRMRAIIERYLDSFSTALPKQYIVEDYYFSKDNTEIIINYENIKNYKPEEYSLAEYKNKVESLNMLELYFDKKHIVNVNDYPHFLISGASGSGKSYLANQLVIQTILKNWQVVICDIKRSYGLYKNFTDYCYEIDDILDKLHSVESEMLLRMEKLQPALDNNPQTLAVDIGYKPMLVVIEEYISLQSALDKKQKEELERVVKNISVLARQSNIHLMLVMQSAGTENINSTTRSNLTKLLLVHADQPTKHQYGWEEVITNNGSKLEDYKIPHALSLKVRLKNVIEQIIAGEIKEFEVDKIDSDLYIYKNTAIKKAFEYRQKAVALNPSRNIQVIVLQGPPRVGKSTFCKVYAENHNKSICFSSSSNDPVNGIIKPSLFGS